MTCKIHYQEDVVEEMTGGMHFSAGECWDDYRPVLYCKKCGQEFTEQEYEELQECENLES